MASEIPDPRTLNTWEDAFQYPVPAVRKLEQQLRSQAEDNRQQLRTLVGVSYRDLLGTAETIIDMDVQMREVELILGQAAPHCNSEAVDSLFGNIERFKANTVLENSHRNAIASQLAILQICPTIVSRQLKRGGSSLLAAKLLVLARLTHKILSQDADAPPVIVTFGRRLAWSRAKLLRVIDKRMSEPERDMPGLIEDMCAFSLATSSTPTDVLRHFHSVRLDAFGRHLKQPSHIEDHVTKAVKIILFTLNESQILFPKRLADALLKLKDRPLMLQKDVQSLPELKFDIHGRWLPDELRNYTPWPRHDELQKPEAERIVKSWAKQAFKTFSGAMKLLLATEHDFEKVLAFRKEMLEAWPPSDLPGLRSVDVVDRLRELFNNQLSAIIAESVDGLQALPSVLSFALNTPSSNSSLTLWDQSVTSMDYSKGASAFKNIVRDRYNGTDNTSTAVLDMYNKWALGISNIRTLLKTMRDIHWDENISYDLDDLDSRQSLLSEDDPRALEEVLSVALVEASKNLGSALLKIVQNIVKPENGAPHEIILTIRIIRRISQSAESGSALDSIVSTVITAPLHEGLSTFLILRTTVDYERSLDKLLQSSSLAARALWEGTPSLPVQPSPEAFKFLRGLTKDMALYGSDLWSPTAVDAVKQKARQRLASYTRELVPRLMASEKSLTVHDRAEIENGPPVLQESEQGHVSRDKLVQLLFDTLYFEIVLQPTKNSEDEDHDMLLVATDEVIHGLEMDSVLTARLRKNVSSYWKRTYLLFALLVPVGRN